MSIKHRLFLLAFLSFLFLYFALEVYEPSFNINIMCVSSNIDVIAPDNPPASPEPTEPAQDKTTDKATERAPEGWLQFIAKWS